MSGYAVEPAELFTVGARVGEAADDGRSELVRLRAAATDLFAGGWSGAAAAACHEGFDDWAASADRLLAALDELGAALGLTARGYATTESTNASAIQRLAS